MRSPATRDRPIDSAVEVRLTERWALQVWSPHRIDGCEEDREKGFDGRNGSGDRLKVVVEMR
jgi:hypothetical protein